MGGGGFRGGCSVGALGRIWFTWLQHDRRTGDHVCLTGEVLSGIAIDDTEHVVLETGCYGTAIEEDRGCFIDRYVPCRWLSWEEAYASAC